MRAFFDYIFYKLYVWHKWNNELLQRQGIPWNTDLLFDAIWGLSIMQGFIFIAIINVIITLFKLVVLDPFLLYIWGGSIVVIYIYNDYYYRRNKKSKSVIRGFSKKRYSNIPIIMFLVVGVMSMLFSVYLLKIYVHPLCN